MEKIVIDDEKIEIAANDVIKEYLDKVKKENKATRNMFYSCKKRKIMNDIFNYLLKNGGIDSEEILYDVAKIKTSLDDFYLFFDLIMKNAKSKNVIIDNSDMFFENLCFLEYKNRMIMVNILSGQGTIYYFNLIEKNDIENNNLIKKHGYLKFNNLKFIK